MSTEQFLSLLRTFDKAMLVTQRGDCLRSRPMAIAECTDSGKLWFMSRADSGKVDELSENAAVNVALQDGGRFLSITGTARRVRDQAKAAQLWSERQRAWFAQGPADPSLVLIEVVPQHAEYWDRSGLKALCFMLVEARSILCRTPLEEDVGSHAKVHFD